MTKRVQLGGSLAVVTKGPTPTSASGPRRLGQQPHRRPGQDPRRPVVHGVEVPDDFEQ
jgi:hypothetical protein